MADDYSNQEMVDRMRRMVEEAIGRGANLAASLPEDGARKMHNALSWATQILQRTPEDLARDYHHYQLQSHLYALGNWRLTIKEHRIEPFGVPGFLVTARGVPGAARIVAYGADPGGWRSYGTVPLTGDSREAGYELVISSQPPDQWAGKPDFHLRSADPEEIARAVGAWCDAVPLPVLEVPPIGPNELKPLRALAATRAAIEKAAIAGAAWPTLGLLVACDPAAPTVPSPEGAPFPEPIVLTPEGAAALADDLAAIDGPRLLANVPRDARGQLALGVDVALAAYASSYDDPANPARRSRAWLVARTPARRRDPQVVTLTLNLCAGGDRRHRWDEARWLWDGRVAADEAVRWGVAGLDAASLGLAGRAERIQALRDRLAGAAEAATQADRAALCILLQDDGQFREALELYDITLDDRLAGILRGDPEGTLPGDHATFWPPALWAALRALAPWRCDGVLRAEEERVASRPATKSGRKRKQVRLRLLSLPKQTAISKASVMLVRAADGRPRLELESTGTTAIVPEVAWQRPIDLDLRRFGL
jgi:hypothetical protein